MKSLPNLTQETDYSLKTNIGLLKCKILNFKKKKIAYLPKVNMVLVSTLQ